MTANLKSFGKLTLIQALKSTGYVCIIVFLINIMVSVFSDGVDIGKLGPVLINNIISWLWFGIFAVFESRKLETFNTISIMRNEVRNQ
jgi:hypothetical protein